MSLPLLCLCWSLLGLTAGAQQPGASWDFIRGPNSDGHSPDTGLADSWPAEGPPVLWTRELGKGYSSFTGRGGRVFTQYQTLTNQYVICLDAETGKTLWEHEYGWAYKPVGLYPGPRSTPTLDERSLFFTTPEGVLSCLNQADGHLVWRVNMLDQFGARPPDFGYACSPLVVDGMVLLPVGGPGAAVVAFDKNDGSVIWQSGDHDVAYSSLLVFERGGRPIVVAHLKNYLVLLDQKNGQVLDQLVVSHGYDAHSGWPIYSEPFLWLSTPFREGCRMIEVTSDPTPRLVPRWDSNVMSNDVCSSVFVDGYLYGFDLYDVQSKVHRPSRGQFRCIEFATGEPRWENGSPKERRRLRPDGRSQSVGHSSVLHADSKLILLNDTGELILVAAKPDRFQQLARTTVLGGEICWTQPMLLNRRLYVRNHTRAVCVYLGDPAHIDRSDATLLRVADIPQSEYFDLASVVFSVEPEFAMDAPTETMLRDWYWIMLIVGWAVSFPLAWTAARLAPSVGGSGELRMNVFRTLAILCGILGTTLVSGWVNRFVFTWPLALAVAFEVLVSRTRLLPGPAYNVAGGAERASVDASSWSGRLVAAAFILTCVTYFYLCHRLSLAFEWSFLIGFPAALPFFLWLCRLRTRSPVRPSVEWLATALGFTAFYWTGAGVILWKY